MKIPDKIYLEKSLSNPDRLHSQWYPNDVIGGGIEYIRKDALLKWLDGKMTIEGATEGIVGGYDMALKDVIDYINKI